MYNVRASYNQTVIKYTKPHICSIVRSIDDTKTASNARNRWKYVHANSQHKTNKTIHTYISSNSTGITRNKRRNPHSSGAVAHAAHNLLHA